MGVALPADADCLQDPCGAKLGQDSVLGELQGLAFIVRFNATHEVGLSHHHFGEQIHQRVLAGRRERRRHSQGPATAITAGRLVKPAQIIKKEHEIRNRRWQHEFSLQLSEG